MHNPRKKGVLPDAGVMAMAVGACSNHTQMQHVEDSERKELEAADVAVVHKRSERLGAGRETEGIREWGISTDVDVYDCELAILGIRSSFTSRGTMGVNGEGQMVKSWICWICRVVGAGTHGLDPMPVYGSPT